MPNPQWFDRHAQLSLKRLMPRLETVLASAPPGDREVFIARLERYFPRAFELLYRLYAERYDFFYHLEQIFISVAKMYMARRDELKAHDRRRETNPLWFQSETMMGGVCYVDRFAGDLAGLREKLSYFEELGLTYLHLMPLFRCPPEKSDGGYAISDYRTVDPDLGTMDELASLADELRTKGISLVLDFVFNHTSDEHEWAQRALEGDPNYQDFYFMFDDRALPDRYEQHLREIFPEQDPGSFTYRPEVDKWVWTTFRHFQWDLNYANPAVFDAMLNELLFLANQGVEVLRLDAVVFIWKRLGTSCENLPEVHWVIEAFNALVRIAAPALLFKSEAIVHPDAVVEFISPESCQLSYHPTMMALIWNSLATRKVRLLTHSMMKRYAIHPDCSWVNYVRCHDDIGWTFADEDAWELGINGFDHRQFLNAFYTGRFPGSFAKGVPFNYNPENQDMRISGMAASLAGLEQGLERDNALFIEHARRRLVLIHGVILSAGGIPLIYLGDEIAMLNDYSYRDDPVKVEDSRWVHRPAFDWERAAKRHDPDTIPGHLFETLQHLIRLRKTSPVFANGQTDFFDTGCEYVLGFVRNADLLVLANFSEKARTVSVETLGVHWLVPDQAQDMISEKTFVLDEVITLMPYQLLWLYDAFKVDAS